MAAFTLDSIREAAEAKYGSTDIDLGDDFIVKLVNPLRLAKSDRASLMAKQAELEAEDADQEGLLAECIMLVAENPTAGEKLLEAIGDDLALMVQIFKTYSEGSELGEASASES
jgi:hypothetical protein